jgi:hypothetical protein
VLGVFFAAFRAFLAFMVFISKPRLENYKWDATYDTIFEAARNIDRIKVDLQDGRALFRVLWAA